MQSDEDSLWEVPVAGTSAQCATEVVEALAEIFKMNGRGDHKTFIESYYLPICNDEPDGYESVHALAAAVDITEYQGQVMTPEARASVIKAVLMHIACSFAAQALKAEHGSNQAWTYAAEAKRWLGILQGQIGLQCLPRVKNIYSGTSQFARSGADARHVENRKMKAEVHQWCDENMARHKSMDAAASALAGKLFPIAWRTARAWVGEWKKLRSTGTT